MATCRLYIKFRWWAHPYMALVKAFLWTVAPFMDADDERLHAFIERQAKFVVDHGMKWPRQAHKR